jgi:hypothetical protein
LKADGRAARVKVTEPITTGSVGMPVVLDLSNDFDGLAVIACFEAGEAAADMAYFGDPLVVPSQCLGVVGVNLHVGVYGRDGEGNIVIPTIWVDCGPVREGVLPSGVDPAQPEPDWTAQVQAAAQEAKDTAERLAEEVGEWSEAEDGRVAAEEARVTAETARATAETARADAEGERATAEIARATAETARADAETARATAETARADAETGRVAAEDARVTAESARATAETARANAETDRDIAEADRIRAEVERIQNETQRKSAETARVTAESARATAESARVTEWASLKTDAVSATSAANAAATSASTAESDIRAAAERGDFDGISPSASVQQVQGGAVVTVTDRDGTTTATLNDGTSSYASVTKSGDTATITITDARGTTTASVSDGETGDSGVHIGSTAPTDPNKNVWIDPNGGPDYDVEEWTFVLDDDSTVTKMVVIQHES